MKTINLNNKYSFTNISEHKDEIFNDAKYECPHCEIQLVNFSKLKRHIFKNHTEKTGKCFKCDKSHD